MNGLLTRTAPHLSPPREEPQKRSRDIPVKPSAAMPSIAPRTRRHSMPGVLAALSGRRGTSVPPRPGGRAPAGSGVSPIVGGASRGVAILIGR